MRLFLALLILSCTNAAFCQDAKQIDGYVSSLMQKRGIPGLSLAVVKEGKVVYAKGYGLADVENGVPASPETVYEIGSVTKQFTAALVMQLVEEGKVKLDEPARTYLPKLPEAWKAVTVRHLLTHTSGIKSYTDLPAFGERMREPVGKSSFLAFVAPEAFDFAPGEKWKYNNTGYFLLGMLLEEVTGASYRSLLKERIFEPLGMKSTDVNSFTAIVKNRARGYDPNPNNGPRNAMFIDMSWPYAAGAIASTVVDLAKWDAALYGDKLLKQASWKEVWSPVKLNSGKTFAYGFGWEIKKINEFEAVEHGGDIPGFNADILRIPSKKLTIIALCNGDPGISEPVARGVAAIVDPSLKAIEKGIDDPDPKTTAAHKGILLDILAGTTKKDAFTKDMQGKLLPELPKVRVLLNNFGKLETFLLIKTEMRGDISVRVYRARVGEQGMNMTVATDKDGKISGFSLTPD